MELIKNPWNDLFCKMVGESRKSIRITSPYVKSNIVSKLLSSKKSNVRVSLLTSFKLMNYYSGASDLEALEQLLSNNGTVNNFQKLHSKIYIFDELKAIITSGNLTNGGLFNNYEYGILLDDINIVKQIGTDFTDLLNHENTGIISLNEINQAKEIISKVPKSQHIVLPDIHLTGDDQIEIFTGGVDSITSSLKGWKLDVFMCLLKIENPEFTLKDVNYYVPYLQQKHPGNNNIEAKVRQQLQYLRDIGLLEFSAKGKYRKLWA